MEWVTSLFQGVSSSYLCQMFLAVLPIWLLGAVTGYLMPRPKFFSVSSLLLTGTGLRNAVLACHSFFIFREVWYKITDPGTFRRFCKAVLLLVCGQGWHFDFPSSDKSGVPAVCQRLPDSDTWYVTEKDLAFFQYHGEGTGATQGAGPWELMMDREIDSVMKYTAWRRVLPSGKTEYKSITIAADSTAEETNDLYFDDDFRPQWDAMINSHDIAENGDFAQRQQVVRWTRKFPFSFITSRQYTIARRFFQQGSDLYGITKAIDHPSSALDNGVVSVDVFHSMWRSRTIACPWGSDKPASETLLLHHEQLKIPENLARFAVRHGMWGVVKKMAAEHPKFIAARRARGISPKQLDPNAYGFGSLFNPVMSRHHDSSLSLASMASSNSDASSEVDAVTGIRRSKATASRKLRGFAAFAIASSLAVLVGRNNKSEGMLGSRRGMIRSTSMASGMSSASKTRSHRYRFSSLEPMTE